MSNLDAIDLRILDVMQRDASLSSAQTAERVGLSQSSCWRRMQRLHEDGYIKAVVALVDPKKVGLDLQVFANVKMRTLTHEERDAFTRAVNAAPEILECWSVFGECDCLMRIIVPDVAWYQDFIFNVLLKMPGVIDVRSTVTLSESKSTTAVPLKSRTFR